MDRQDAKPSRPSLLAGAQTSAVAGSPPARILSDLQDRPVGSGDAANTWLRRGIPMLLGVMTIGLAAWWWQAGSGSDSESSSPASRLATQGTDNPFLIADSGAGAAATRATPRQRPSAPRRAAAAASGDEPDLLAILMGNIKPGQDAATHEGSGLDAFIRTMETEDTGMASVDENRNGRPQRARSQQIQQNLRECPAANTAKGLKCRQEICAVYAGRDPACPANG